MGYTHFKGISVTQHSYAVGSKGNETTVIGADGKLVQSVAFPADNLIGYAYLKGRAAVTKNASATLTVAELIDSGIITSSLSDANATLTTPAASAIVAAIPDCKVGTWFEVTIVNTTANTYKVTLAGGTGVTIVGSADVSAASSGTFLFLVTNVGTPAVSVYRE